MLQYHWLSPVIHNAKFQCYAEALLLHSNSIFISIQFMFACVFSPYLVTQLDESHTGECGVAVIPKSNFTVKMFLH